MNVRIVRVIAFSFPLVLGLAACTSSRSQSERGSAASVPASQRPGSASSRDPMAVRGPSVMGHASDRIVDGRISSVSDDALSIASDRGDTTTLKLVPETSIEVNGSDATRAELREGQPVRASFNDVDGQEIAVRVRAGDVRDASAPLASPRPSQSGELQRPEAWWEQAGPGGEQIEVPRPRP